MDFIVKYYYYYMQSSEILLNLKFKQREKKNINEI